MIYKFTLFFTCYFYTSFMSMKWQDLMLFTSVGFKDLWLEDKNKDLRSKDKDKN